MNDFSKHKKTANKSVKFKTNPLLQEGGDDFTPTPTMIKDMHKSATPTPDIVLKTQTPLYEIILRETVVKDKSIAQRAIDKKTLNDIVAQTDKALTQMVMDKSKMTNLKKGTSFSPKLNKQLIDIASTETLLLDDCDTLETAKDPKVRMTVNGREKCVSYKEKMAQEYMLKLLNDKKPADCSMIVAPRQIMSNCWFNTMFMIYFVSDKGRKFNRFFRQLMIIGKTLNGLEIPARLHKIFFKLNMSIQACLNSDINSEDRITQIADTVNTNIYIKQIHRMIKDKEVRGINMSGNPKKYYDSIISYLGSEKPMIMTATVGSNSTNGSRSWLEQVKKEQTELGEAPDVIVLQLFMDRDNEHITDKARNTARKRDFTLNIKNEKGKKEAITYRLDAAAVRNTKQHHFCSTITCDGKDFAFDGLSFSRLTPYDWKSKLNEDIDWTFDYQGEHNISFNFTSAYQLLFYYRQ